MIFMCVAQWTKFFRIPTFRSLQTPIASVLLVAWTAFCCPGMFSALNALGAAGEETPKLSNIANAIVFGIIAAGGFVVAPFIDLLGIKLSLFVGTLCYSTYGAALYCNNRYGTEWFIIFSAVLMGLGAVLLWGSSGSILLGYPSHAQQARSIAVKFCSQNLGGSVGGMVSLGFNAKDKNRGSVSYATFLTFTAIMAIAWPAAIFLPNPRDVSRPDGSKIKLRDFRGWKDEYNIHWETLTRKEILTFIPFLIYSQWDLSYMWSWNAAYHSVRARALLSLLFYLVGPFCLGAVTGVIMDSTRWSRKTRARSAYSFTIILSVAVYTYGIVVQYQYQKRPVDEVIDWLDPAFIKSAFLFILYGWLENHLLLFTFWIVGSLTRNFQEVVSLATLMNGVAGIGTVIAFVLGAVGLPLDRQLWALFGAFAGSVFPAAYTVWSVTDQPQVDNTSESFDIEATELTFDKYSLKL